MSISVVIPWRSAPSRIDAFDRVTTWYAQNLPEVRVTTIDTNDDVFVLSRCRNLAIGRVDDPDEVIVVGDADTIPERGPLLAAVAAAATSGMVHLPYTEYRWLGAEGSAQFAAGTPLIDCAVAQLVDGACSGVYVTTRRTWERHGGQDERFRGWGFEDAAWYRAHTALLGAPPARHEGRVYALHHVGEARAGTGYERNAALMERYRAAEGDAAAMAALVAEGQRLRAENARSAPGAAR
ncbi:hypothetical protein [uncultured Microbacterium sp.]|uniref:hypothetical protein n=1 Tax=uncultured Microbacterium sp. TaxID=191216 RepID=UPI0035CAE482